MATVSNLFDGKIPEKCEAHLRFYQSWMSLQPDMLPKTIEIASRYSSYPAYFVGHSMGGALATFASVAFYLATNQPNRIGVPTFGQPRLADLDFVNYLNGLPFANRFWRVVNSGDIVPLLPSKISGFYHTKNQKSLDGTTISDCIVDETKDDPKICLGLGSNFKSHGNY
jgi:predicted lipase